MAGNLLDVGILGPVGFIGGFCLIQHLKADDALELAGGRLRDHP